MSTGTTCRSAVPMLLMAIATLLACCLVGAPPALATAGESCLNEQVRAESNVNPATGQPYSLGLPECRAYEMVSPLEKQQHDALTVVAPGGISVSPAGSAIEWVSQGAYAGAENYLVPASRPGNPYLAQRTASGWATRSTYPPLNLIEDPATAFGGVGVYSGDLADETVCGGVTSTGQQQGPAIRCALRDPAGAWTGTPTYTDLTGVTFGGNTVEALGGSSNAEDVVFYGEAGAPFLPADTSSGGCTYSVHCAGIYEETGIGTGSPELRLVDVDNGGNMIGPQNGAAIGALANGPGNSSGEPSGSSYQAVSTDGSKIFFTATPSGGVATVYARVSGEETVAISNPSPAECTTCAPALRAAAYQGAAADGSKVFFTTAQQLLDSDTDTTSDLYEYDFDKPPARRIVQVSGGGLGDVTPGAGAEVKGVVSVSADGSHVSFVAAGVLTTLPNGLGQTAAEGDDNLYAYDANTGETKFVATLLGHDQRLWGVSEASAGTSSYSDPRLAQTTASGSFLAFASFAELTTAGAEADTSGAQQVYRYDFQTASLIRVSLGHEGFADNGNTPGFNAVIAPADDATEGASPAVNDANRSISEDGETIAFVSAARLQSSDVADGGSESCDEDVIDAAGPGCQVYAWHDGAVNMISDGQDPDGAVYAGMSASGSDIFFQTRTQLVGQDTDSLGDIYDALIGGGFPAPAPAASCAGEACQGPSVSAPAFGAPGTSSVGDTGNLAPGPTTFPTPGTAKPRPPTRAQKLANALRKCRQHKRGKQRVTCEKQARRRYRPAAKKQR